MRGSRTRWRSRPSVTRWLSRPKGCRHIFPKEATMSGGGSLGPGSGPSKGPPPPENRLRRSRPPAGQDERVRHVVVYEPGSGPEGGGTHSLLEHQGYQLTACGDGEGLLEAVVVQRPDAVVYVFREESAEELGFLRLLRRLAPAVPIVVLAGESSLALQRVVQRLRPIYYAVAPVEPAEIRAAVQSA